MRVEESTSGKSTYRQILRATALVGGSQVAIIAVGIVRIKVLAVLLGPSGVGLFGLYGSISTLVQSIAGMGVNSSGVRQIAEAVGSGDKERIARTALVLRRISVLLAGAGAVLLVVFSRHISKLTFGTDQHAIPVSLLSIAVFLGLVSAGQGALIQGMRNIAHLAKMGVWGALLGTLITLPLVYFFREQGVVPSIIGVAAMMLVASWWYSRKVRVGSPSMTPPQIAQEAGALLKLGFAFMASGLMTMGSAYVVRTAVLRTAGIESTGLYQSAWTLGGLYAGFILQAMGADFFPRLTASAHDNTACNRMVNEQARVGMLLAGPGMIATLTLAPLVIALFYSSTFEPAVGLLRWMCLGVTLRVITWPMGFIVLAKGRQTLFFWIELAWTVVYLGLAWVGLEFFGLNGVGIAFFGSYVFQAILLYPIVNRLWGFRWSTENKRTGLVFLLFIGAVFCGFYVLPIRWAAGLGISAGVLISIFSLRDLLQLTSLSGLPDPVRRILVRFGFTPAT